MATTTGEVPFRILPRITDRNVHFWQGGRDGELRFQRCRSCGYYLHPPAVICPKCWTNIVNCDPDDVQVGLAVQVIFEPHTDDDVWIPLFEPVR
jgi:uncharacterized OB-fold protein